MTTYPIRACPHCGPVARVNAATLTCTICGCDPFTPKSKPAGWAGILAGALHGRDLGDEDSPEAYEDDAWPYTPEQEAKINEVAKLSADLLAARTLDGGSVAYRALLDEMWQLHIAKNTGYAGYSPDPWANFRQCEAFGISAACGVLTRMSDKWSRLQSLWKNPERDRVGESIKDTLIDLSAYALILICLLEEDA